MQGIRCAVCGEPWDGSDGMAPWEYDLFRRGAGCLGCEGCRPEGVSPDEALGGHLGSLLFDEGCDDPDDFSRLGGGCGDRPKWERPEDDVLFECAGCDSRLLGNVDFPKDCEFYRYWHTPTVDRYYHHRPTDRRGDHDWSTDLDDLFEVDYDKEKRKYCYACADACSDCGETILTNESCTGTFLVTDTYDPGASHADPRNYRSICTACFEAIPTCGYCGSVLGEDEDTDSEGRGECCAKSSAPDQCEEEPEGGGDYCDSTRFDWDSDKKAWVCCHCDREHPRDSRFE